MIPQEKSAAVTRGLHEAFGVTEYEEIRALTDGPGWNPVYRIVVRGTPVLFRLNLRAGDVACHYACMRAAAEAGLSPRVWYTSVEDRVSITDFVEAVPFPPEEALARMPVVLRSLHALPPFPERAPQLNTTCTFLLHPGPALDGFFRAVQASNILPRCESQEFFARYEEIAAAYSRLQPDRVSSHNDLFKPDNILFDSRRVWLVDFEAAFLNDRYADLAVVANLVVTNDAEEKAFLQAYFGEPPSPYQQARFFLMEQLSHMFYAMGFLLIGSAGSPVDWSEKAPEFRELYRRIWEREANLSDNRVKVEFGKIHWERFWHNTRQPRYEDALRIVSARQAVS